MNKSGAEKRECAAILIDELRGHQSLWISIISNGCSTQLLFEPGPKHGLWLEKTMRK